MQKTIFIVDDSNTNLLIAREALCEEYKVITLSSAAKMFTILEKIQPDLILLDIEMPEMDGIEVLTHLKADASKMNIPVILLTGTTDPAVEAHCFHLGAVDFVTKPFSRPVLLNRIKTHLNIDELIRKQTMQIQLLQNSTISILANIIENRDSKTGGHIERTVAYMKILIDTMLEKGLYNEMLSCTDIDLFVSASRLHDVGKIIVTDSILNKPGKLLNEEYELIKTHTTIGEQIIDDIIDMTGDVAFLQNAKLFAGYHHERWDGKGYPYGLKGTKIPFHGRVMPIIDVYDALLSERSYKAPISHEKAVEIIMDNAGMQFDPTMADLFFEVRDEFKAVNLAS